MLGATWTEIDLRAKTWTIPKGRMKAKREHRVPLSDRCVEILKTIRKIVPGDKFVFARDGEHPLSNMVFLMTLRRMGFDVTAHGFRSAFRDWAAETHGIPAGGLRGRARAR